MALRFPSELAVETQEQVFSLPFVALSEREALPDEPGLYFVVIDRIQVVYVGISATSIRRRWDNHHRAWEFEYFGEVSIAYLTCAEWDHLWRAEEYAIYCLKTPCNDRPPYMVEMVSVDGQKRVVALCNRFRKRQEPCKRYIWDDSA